MNISEEEYQEISEQLTSIVTYMMDLKVDMQMLQLAGLGILYSSENKEINMSERYAIHAFTTQLLNKLEDINIELTKVVDPLSGETTH